MKHGSLLRDGLVIRLKTHLLTAQADLQKSYLANPDAEPYLFGRSRLIDEVLHALWKALEIPDSMALVAVGGYGRGKLFPASDIDLLILLSKPPSQEQGELLEFLVGHFWDIGLKIGHSVRTIDECLSEAAKDLTIQTTLLEMHLIAGNTGLLSELALRFRDQLDAQTFFLAKRMEQEERHLRYKNTPNSLEPNCKESPGGLRDLQTIQWIADAAGYGSCWKDLHKHGLITRQSQRGLQRLEDFLSHLRIQLHFHTNRQDDRLSFAHQTALAEQLGISATATKLASENLMQRYYRAAKTVAQANMVLLQTLSELIFPAQKRICLPINARFQNTNQLLDITHDRVFEETPSAILEAFLVMQQHAELDGMTARTMQALWRSRRRIDRNFRSDPENRKNFIELFRQPSGILNALRRMDQFAILGRYLPKFGKIVGQMQHDLFHTYTVDQHILLVVRNLRRFLDDNFAHEYPFCSHLIGDFDGPWRLYIAALFHDIAKGRSGNHSNKGAVDARKFCHDHELSEDDTKLVVWLVDNHLAMSNVAQKQDISDPNILAAFASTVKDEEHLVALYLLTVADIRATSPKVWNGWKGQLLETLFIQTRQILQAGGKVPAKHGIIRKRKADALQLLDSYSVPENVIKELWDTLDTVYFLRHSAEEVAWHVSQIHGHLKEGSPLVRARLKLPGNDIEVFAYMHDQKDLFVRLAGYFSLAGYNILDAKIHTTKHGYALDSFVLQDASGRDHGRETLDAIEQGLTTILTDQTHPRPPGKVLASGRAKYFPIQPTVSIFPDDRGAHFILTVTATDRPGLLYTVAKTLSSFNINLHTAKISTQGERVEDTFLITGGSLAVNAIRMQLETELLEQLK